MSTQLTALAAKAAEKAHQAALDILGSFYGSTRAWTANEIITAKRLEARGWIPARASYIATWLEDSRDGAHWRHFTSQKDGICAIEKAIDAIEARCGAEQHAPRAPKAEPDPAFDAHWDATCRSFAQLEAEVHAPWEALWAEAEAAGLKGHQAAEFCRLERGRRMKGKHLPGHPVGSRYDGSPAFGLVTTADGRTFFNPPMQAPPRVTVRTDPPPPDAIEAEYRAEDEYPDVQDNE